MFLVQLCVCVLGELLSDAVTRRCPHGNPAWLLGATAAVRCASWSELQLEHGYKDIDLDALRAQTEGVTEMTDVLRLVSPVDGRNLRTLLQLSENDIECIWADISSYIEQQMTAQKGVQLSGLGTFTFSQQKLNLGHRFVLIQRPIFLLAGKLSQSLGLRQIRPLAAVTHLPVVQLNFAAVSQETPFSRDVVEGCVRETLQLLFRALASEKNVYITFHGIGVLSFNNNKVRMRFNKDFINAMDGSGRMLMAFNNRPGSSVSLLSEGQSRLQRPGSHILLPTVGSPQPDRTDGDKVGLCLSPAPHQRNAGEVPPQRESKTHQTLQPVRTRAVTLSEQLDPNPPMEETDKNPASMSPPEVSPQPEPARGPVCCSYHVQAGQELCYLCTQRAQRNVPVYLREQQEAEEKAQEKLLLLKEQERDKQYMEEQQAKLQEQREHAKLVATFNLNMSEKRVRTSCSPPPTSFIFPARLLTPPRRIQQQRYMNDLQSQMERRRQHVARDQQKRLQLERLDQVQLGQEIALQKAEHLQKKHQRTENYKKALDTQVEAKRFADPEDEQPDDLSFSRCETAESLADGRERAQKLFQVNVGAATQRKKEELHKRQTQLEREKEMLKHNRMQLILDHINRLEKRRNLHKALEDEWSRSRRLKHQREEEERRFLRSAGHLLVDKLTQYPCCAQCKRRTTNRGESNIWKDSHYPSGSQFMI